ncbi:lipopolysaccharide biosynthesis protein [Arcobacter sp.]|uniref:lipopolysaccharide biosynthesis protein n=1 Tax=Arcobacter sp. TaxID=1872629 RepID=UPI003C743B09
MEDSLKKRYIIKLFSNIVNGLINIILVAIVPKALGPIAFGQFSYIQQFFSQILAFLDAGTSTAFFTKLSAKNQRKELINFYFFFSLFLLFLLFLFIYLLDILDYLYFFLPEIANEYIYLGLWFGFLTWMMQIFVKISDAYALTVSVELIKIVHKLFTLFILILLIYYFTFDLSIYFYFHLFSLFSFLFILSILFSKKNIFQKNIITYKNSYKNLIKEFYTYSSPLFIFNIIAISIGLFDIWLLQKISGSVQTGFYGLAYSIAAMCFLFTSAMTPIITREFSKSYENKDIDQIQKLFKRYIPMLYSIAAYFGVFIAFQADNLLMIFTDEKFKDALFVLVIMAFYPIHQTYGQLSGSLFFALEETKLYRNIGIFSSFLGLGLTLLFVYYLELGAIGFAWKMVISQIISVNIQLYFNVKFLNLKMFPLVWHQVYAIIILSLLAYLSARFISFDKVIWEFLLSGLIYSIGVGITIFLYPQIVAVSKSELIQIFAKKKS